MADRRRIVTLSANGVPSPVVDLERPDGGLVVVTNLVTNPSFEVDTAGWAVNAFGGALTRESGWASVGAWAGRYIKTGTGYGGAITPTGTAGMPVVGGAAYSFRAVLNIASNPQAIRCLLTWYTAAGAVDSTGYGTAEQVAAGLTGVRTLTFTNVAAPAAAAFVAVEIASTGNMGAADTLSFYFDAVMLTAGSTVPAYGDGDTAGWQWTGTPHASTSVQLTGQIVSVRDSFKITAPVAQPIMARRQRRYGGSRTVSETHDNGMISTTLLMSGQSTDDCLKVVSDLLTITQSARSDLFFEWRPDGATSSVFYEIRGPGRWNPNYKWIEMNGAQMLRVDLEFPVAPLARLAPLTFAIGSSTLPTVFTGVDAVTGDAPALADVTLRTTGGAAAPIWALLAWWKTVTATPLAGSVAPVGIIEAETATGLVTWAAIGTDANYRGSNGLRATTAGAGTASASFVVDPSVLAPDDFALGEVDIEVWARVELAAGVVSPRLTMSLTPDAGVSFGQPAYTAEFGSVGKPLVRPSSGTAFRRVRLGVLTMPVDPAQPLKWRIKVDASWAAGSAGVFGLDYLECTPARARACSKTGVANDAYYPDFIASTSDTSKTVRSDLSGLVGSAALNKGRDTGLGGSLIELPPGDVDFLLHLSSLVPDDPSSDSTSEQLSHTGVTGSIVVWPRVHLAKGT